MNEVSFYEEGLFMFKVGLCSITFRDLSVEQVIALSVRAELDGIEWGGDYHVHQGS